MIMLDTVDFPAAFLGAMRAGIVPVPLNTLLTADQYAYVLADCRVLPLFISEALYPVVKDVVGRMGDLDCVVLSGKNSFGHKLLSKSSKAKAIRSRPRRRIPTSLPSSLSVGLNRHAQGGADLHANLAATAETYARQVLGIREDAVFYRRRNCFSPMASATR